MIGTDHRDPQARTRARAHARNPMSAMSRASSCAISQAHAGQRRSERRVDPVTRLRQHDALRHAFGARGLDLVKGDLRFGLEHDVLGTPVFARRTGPAAQSSGR